MLRACGTFCLVPLLLAACGDSGGGTDAGDAGTSARCRTHSMASFELGTGAAEFEPLTDGQDLEMVPGIQGGCHFWVSVRTDGFAQRRLNIDYDVVYADTGTTTQSASNETVRLLPREGTDGLCEYVGMTAFLIQPWEFEDDRVRIEVTLTDDEGRTEKQTKTVVARWPSQAFDPGTPREEYCGER